MNSVSPNHQRITTASPVSIPVAPSDRALSIIFAFLFLSPYSNYLFTTPLGYLVEIAFLIFAFTVAALSRLRLDLIWNSARISFATFMFLSPFAVIGIFNGAALTDVYANTRAPLAFAITIAILYSLQRSRALAFIRASAFTSLLLWLSFLLLLSAGVIIDLNLNRSAGKIFPPILLGAIIVIASMKLNKSGLLIVALAAITVALPVFTSMRFIYISAALTLVMIILFFVRRFFRFAPQFISVAVLSFMFLKAASDFEKLSLSAYQMLIHWASRTVSLGLDPAYAHQIFVKTAQTISGYNLDTGRGDAAYLLFFRNLLNFDHFSTPQGLGQKSFIGHERLWGLNSIDGSIIYLNFHFSIWITIPILIIVFVLLCYSFVTVSKDGMGVLAVGWLLFLFISYFRAHLFVHIDAAIVAAFFIFCATANLRNRSRINRTASSLRLKKKDVAACSVAPRAGLTRN